MKNRLLVMAGTLALVAALGKFYAVPALAQTVRAALVRDIDNHARNYVTLELANGDNYTVPAGKILVLEEILGGSQTYNSNATFNLTFGTNTTQGNDNRWDRFITLPPAYVGATSVSMAQPFHVYARGGQTLHLAGSAGAGQLYFQGYLLDAN